MKINNALDEEQVKKNYQLISLCCDENDYKEIVEGCRNTDEFYNTLEDEKENYYNNMIHYMLIYDNCEYVHTPVSGKQLDAMKYLEPNRYYSTTNCDNGEYMLMQESDYIWLYRILD